MQGPLLYCASQEWHDVDGVDVTPTYRFPLGSTEVAIWVLACVLITMPHTQLQCVLIMMSHTQLNAC